MDSRFLRRLPPRDPAWLRYLKQYWSILLLLLVTSFIFVILFIVRIHLITGEEGAVVKEIVIKPGMTVSRIGDLLLREELIDRKWHFTAWVRLKKAGSRLKAGKYRLATNYPVPVIVQRLVSGKSIPVKVTIPEGLTVRETISLISRRINIDSLKIAELVADRKFINKLDLFGGVTSLEGFLFPDTYQFGWDTNEKKVITTMVRNFKKVFLEEYAEKSREVNLNLYKILTLASIVEKEARREDERALIAAVFHNRLKKRKYLESCATVNYILSNILGRPKRPVLLNKDLKIKSPYNTYSRFGLPPGPICSPGRAALKAAMNPADSKALYFVNKGDGSHYFSQSFREHINAKNKYRPLYKKRK